jgi:molybdenum cofactor cytidylyltransferase
MNIYAAVLLAAGDSQRMGTPKAMLEFRKGINFLEACLQAFRDFSCAGVVVVVNAQLYERLKSNEVSQPENVHFILNDHPERGRFFSLQCGLKALSAGTNTFFHNVDNPFISPDVLNALATKARTSDVTCPAYEGKRGHPVLISGRVVSDVISESNYDWNLRDYLDRYHNESVRVTDPNILVNINTPEDYARLLGRSIG